MLSERSVCGHLQRMESLLKQIQVRIMRIILRNIPLSMVCRELEDLVRSRLKRRWRRPFAEKPVIYSCRVVKASTTEGKESEIFGLVTIRPRNAAMGVIERLSEAVVNDVKISAREFFDRTYQRDRRKHLRPDNHAKKFVERRRTDRRRYNTIEVICSTGSSGQNSAYMTTASLF